jgi:hypothetical protein
MTIEEFRRAKQRDDDKSLRETLMHPQGDDFDFDPPRLQGSLSKEVDLD